MVKLDEHGQVLNPLSLQEQERDECGMSGGLRKRIIHTESFTGITGSF